MRSTPSRFSVLEEIMTIKRNTQSIPFFCYSEVSPIGEIMERFFKLLAIVLEEIRKKRNTPLRCVSFLHDELSWKLQKDSKIVLLCERCLCYNKKNR